MDQDAGVRMKGLGKALNMNMREVLYKNQVSAKNRRRVITVSEKAQRNGYLTRTQKNFIYIVEKAGELVLPEEPVVFISKIFNTKTHREKFLLRIKGIFYVSTKEDYFLKVHFCHSIKIELEPKRKVMASK